MKKILVIEDAQSLRRDILEMLMFEGFEVVGAENGLAGVQRAKEEVPDLIICDIMMPVMDGYGVLEELRRDKVTSTIPFIFLTARTDRVDVRQGMGLGADDYLTKPFTASELLETVHARLEKADVIAGAAEERMDHLRQSIIMALPHELRTPLNVILGFSDLLMTDYQMLEPMRMGEMARHINHAAMRLYRLIENFLIYANIEIIMSAPEQLETLRTSATEDPRTVIEVAILQKVQQENRDADLRMDLEEVSALQVLEDYLKKIAEELIDNAMKFSVPGKPIFVEGKRDGDFYLLTVTDHGRGMTPEQIADIGAYMQFERRFYEQQGSGLGLVIVRRLAELHGGEMTIRSTPNVQTKVEVKLRIPR